MTRARFLVFFIVGVVLVSPALAECGTVVMAVPAYSCRQGEATAAVPAVAGASYQWSIQGGTLLDGAGTHRVKILVTDAMNAKLAVSITTPECTSTASGEIPVREPLAVKSLVVPDVADAGIPVTIQWSYDGAAQPASQVLGGDAFEAPVTLGAEVRSYTFKPQLSGTRTIDLRASYAVIPLSNAPPAGKRRASPKSTVSATECPLATSSARLEVRGCGLGKRPIDAPESFAGGEPFKASVQLVAGENVRWTIQNGTAPVLNQPEIEVTPNGGEGDVALTARIERGVACFMETDAIVTRRPRECTNPKAFVDFVSDACDETTVRVWFTGQPPFSGSFSDGTIFETSSAILIHEVQQQETPRAFTITSFRDAVCEGEASGEVEVAASSGATITALSCGRVKATFRGVPPFSGSWNFTSSDDAYFIDTNDYEHEITATEDGLYWLQHFRDSRCERVKRAGTPVHVISAPFVSVDPRPICVDSPDSIKWISASVHGEPPYVVEWTDGVVVTSNDPHVSRQVIINGDTSFDIARATANGCDAEVLQPKATFTVRPPPTIKEIRLTACLGQEHQVFANVPPHAHPDLKLEWSIDNCEIVSGQGTPTATYRCIYPGPGMLYFNATYSDGFCEVHQEYRTEVKELPSIKDLRIAPSTISAGGTARILFTEFKGSGGLSFVLPPDRSGAIQFDGCASNICTTPNNCTSYNCTATYTDTKGKGTVPIEVRFGNVCDFAKSETITLTIE